ncbi:hypothetical protein [Rhodopirellula sp. MGV]|uniref:hypothetical protein n=1 Tax=Rhodopirellula sp. MGV TaxID=2023130 RepID=UPI000B972D32|nr:hypothetical protein [Rhodopirellula sp. MGV]OYP35979.1 hypothetical protein CGZ80_09465 [Rhodopirellula sp. MGV]PNY36664.1 hypothetical protein C2E31_12540 [Rhodopirellula baltica]
MIDEKLLKWVRCPITGQNLHPADDSLLTALNEKISAGDLRDRSDQLVGESLQGGLVSENAEYLYPVRGGIPSLVADAAIELGD